MGKHIILVNTGRVINAWGGVEKVFCEMANALVSLGYSVTAICFDKNQGKPGFNLVSDVRFINAYRIGKLFNFLQKSVFSFSFERDVRCRKRLEFESSWKAEGLQELLNKLPVVDLLISFQPETTYLLSKIKCLRAPIITMLHCPPSYFSAKREFKFIQKSVNISNVVTVLMPGFVSSAHKIFPDVLVEIMPNAIPSYNNPARLVANKIVCIARLAKQKRVELLVEAFYLIKNKYPDWIVEFWGETEGDPAYRDKIFNLRRELEMEDRIIFKGVTSNVEDVLSEASIFAFPSLSEGFGLALGEAMSKGVPAVGCIDCPAVNELIKNEQTGLLVKPTPEDFSLALSRLIDSYELRVLLGGQARVNISEFFPNKIWTRWDVLIKKLTDNRK